MPAPTDPTKATYMFTDDIKFLQKIIVVHPIDSTKFLTLKRSPDDRSRPNCWDLAGGNVHFGEKHDESLIREVEEEAGLTIIDPKPVQVLTNVFDGVYHLFIGHAAKATSDKVIISHEHTEYKWVSVDEFMQLESAEFLQNFVKEWAKNI